MSDQFYKQCITAVLGTTQSPNKEPYRIFANNNQKEMNALLGLSMFHGSNGGDPNKAVNEIFSYRAAEYLIQNNYRVDDAVKPVITQNAQMLANIRTRASAALAASIQRPQPFPMAPACNWPNPTSPTPTQFGYAPPVAIGPDPFAVPVPLAIDNGQSPIVPAYIQRERDKIAAATPSTPATSEPIMIPQEPTTPPLLDINDPVPYSEFITTMDINKHRQQSHFNPATSTQKASAQLSKLQGAVLTQAPESIVDPGLSLVLDEDVGATVVVAESCGFSSTEPTVVDGEWLLSYPKDSSVDVITQMLYTRVEDGVEMLSIATLVSASGVMGAMDFLSDLIDRSKRSTKDRATYLFIFDRWNKILTDMMIDVLQYLIPGLSYDGEPDNFYTGIEGLMTKDMSTDESETMDCYFTNWICTYTPKATQEVPKNSIFQLIPTIYIDGVASQLGLQFASLTDPLILSDFLHKELLTLIRTMVGHKDNWRCRLVTLDTIFVVYLSPMDKESIFIRTV